MTGISGCFGSTALIGTFFCLTAFGGGCAINAPQPISPVAAGLGCVDDSQGCRNRRQVALNALLADKSKAWIRQPSDAAAYASGVRLFAFKKRKRELSCAELKIGQLEAKAARATLQTAKDRLTTAQIARGALLGDEVDRELARERRKRRCKA